ncbi:MAG: ATP synthase F1 subunit delta [Bacteroidales bacterium]|nr:ATP synthase F1 subunit delta [Bacteroidales bacterium]
MNEYRVNLNYAKALMLVASDTDSVDTVCADMRLVYEVCAENRELVVVLVNPCVKESAKLAIVGDIFGSHVSQLSLAFMNFLIRKKRTVNLKGIARTFIELYREQRGIELCEIVTAKEVQPELLDEVRQAVGQYTGKDVELVSRVDNRMLGGYRLMFNNNMYDARLRTKIRKLRIAFSENIYESKL